MRPDKKFTLGFLSTLFALIAMIVAGCGGTTGPSHQAKAPASQQVYRIALQTADIATFDPALVQDTESNYAVESVFTGLVALNDKLQVVPEMATSWSTSPDGLTWTFHLHTGMKFSDGSPLDANNIAYSIDRALSPAVESQNGVTKTYLGLIKDSDMRIAGKISTLVGDSIKVVDPNTLELIISKPASYFLDALVYSTSYAVEKSVIDKWGAKWTDHLNDNGGQGGAGPWKVQSYSHSTGITLVPNPNYYGPKPQLQKLEFVFFKDTATAYKAFQAGQIDRDRGVPTQDILAAQKDAKEYLQYPSLAIFYLTLNYLYKPFDNIDIRQAFDVAINRDIIVSSILHGAGIPTCHIVPQGMPGYNPNLSCPAGTSTKGDAAKAKQLLQAGMAQEHLTTLPPITLTSISGDVGIQSITTTIRQMWQSALGVTVNVNYVDFNTIVTQSTETTCQTPNNLAKCQNKGLQAWFLGWIADYPHPQDWTSLQFGNGAPYNEGNYGQNLSNDASSQVQTQQLLNQADGNTNQAASLAQYNQAEQQLVNDVGWVSLYQSDTVDMLRSDVVGVSTNKNGEGLVNPQDWANIYIAAH